MVSQRFSSIGKFWVCQNIHFICLVLAWIYCENCMSMGQQTYWIKNIFLTHREKDNYAFMLTQNCKIKIANALLIWTPT